MERTAEPLPVQAADRTRWSVGDEHVMLSSGILPDELGVKGLVPASRYWCSLFAHLNEELTRNETAGSAHRFRSRLEEAYANEFRGMGVRGFYRAAAAKTGEYVAYILARIGDDLKARFLDAASDCTRQDSLC